MNRGRVIESKEKPKKPNIDFQRLYEDDETAWLEQMAELIEAGEHDKLDYENLSKFLIDMAKRDRREVASRLTTLLLHLLKWEHQKRKRSRSWQSTIATERFELHDLLESKTLKNHAAEILVKSFDRAVKKAAIETGLTKDKFPNECPYTLEELLEGES